MAGGWQTYRCGRCPLVLELGGSTFRDEAGVVCEEMIQLACAACGTMHRITHEGSDSRVSARSGPIRGIQGMITPENPAVHIELPSWIAEDGWRPLSQLTPRISAIEQLECGHCGRYGEMLSLAAFLYPCGYTIDTPRREECPICHGPMECIAVTDAI